MNTDNNTARAQLYYKAMAEKNSAEVEKYLHPDVSLVGPYGEKTGKEIVFPAAQKFMQMFKGVEIHSCFGSGEHVVITYDLLECGQTAQALRAASVMTFKDGFIIKNELFLIQNFCN